MVEGTPLLREHTGQNLYPGFESLRLRQKTHSRSFAEVLQVPQTGANPVSLNKLYCPPSRWAVRGRGEPRNAAIAEDMVEHHAGGEFRKRR